MQLLTISWQINSEFTIWNWEKWIISSAYRKGYKLRTEQPWDYSESLNIEFLNNIWKCMRRRVFLLDYIDMDRNPVYAKKRKYKILFWSGKEMSEIMENKNLLFLPTYTHIGLGRGHSMSLSHHPQSHTLPGYSMITVYKINKIQVISFLRSSFL